MTFAGKIFSAIGDAAKSAASSVIGGQGDKAQAAIKLLTGDVKGAATSLTGSVKNQVQDIISDAKTKAGKVTTTANNSSTFADIYNDAVSRGLVDELKKSGVKSVRDAAKTIASAYNSDLIKNQTDISAQIYGSSFGDVAVVPTTEPLGTGKKTDKSIYSDVSGSASNINGQDKYNIVGLLKGYWYIILLALTAIYLFTLRRRG